MGPLVIAENSIGWMGNRGNVRQVDIDARTALDMGLGVQLWSWERCEIVLACCDAVQAQQRTALMRALRCSTAESVCNSGLSVLLYKKSEI
jgi:hypothetical protein